MLFLPRVIPGADGAQIVQVSASVNLIYNTAGGWFGLVDRESSCCDSPGAVALALDDLDRLIVALGDLRKQTKPDSDIYPVPI